MAHRIHTKLADALTTPAKVRRMSLFVKRATKLPDFGVFTALEELELFDQGAYIAQFPRVTTCIRLRSLTFAGSAITRVPASIGDLIHLEKLVLVGHRKLRKLPDELCDLAKLRHMRIDSNGLRELPARIGSLRALEELVAYGNALRTLPASLTKLPRLRWLEVQMNLLAKPPPAKLAKLQHFMSDF